MRQYILKFKGLKLSVCYLTKPERRVQWAVEGVMPLAPLSLTEWATIPNCHQMIQSKQLLASHSNILTLVTDRHIIKCAVHKINSLSSHHISKIVTKVTIIPLHAI